MFETDVDDYYIWLVDKVADEETASSYSSLLHLLYDIPFYYTVKNDDNREADAMELRWKFVDEVLPFKIDGTYGIGPGFCSVLEVIVALAIRMENDILYDPDKGDQTPSWFWIMIKNLGLIDMENGYFDPVLAHEIVASFVARKYTKSGQGGLFVTKNPKIDMRKTEIWYQMQFFVKENY